MRVDDLFLEPVGGIPGDRPTFNISLMEQLRAGPVDDVSDIEVAVPLAHLVHDQMERYGTDDSQDLDEDDVRLALRALCAVTDRLGVSGFDPPFRDYGSFRTYWHRKGARGSWQARRDLLEGLFEPLHDQLADLEERALSSTLATPVDTHPRTGWPAIDEEISELRRHFQNACTPQDYRAVGNDCVHVTEALSRHVYSPERHLREGEKVPPVQKTKQRLGRFIEDAVPGQNNAALRKLANATIEFVQEIKHSKTPTARDAGVAADAVIQLAHILRRLAEND